MSTLLTAATLYRDSGLSVIGSSKKGSIISWKEYQKHLPTDAQLDYFFNVRKFPMLAIICGEISGNLEVIDVDTKNDPSGTLGDRLWDAVVELFKGEPPLAFVKTPSGGMHMYYRCDTIDRNQKLALVQPADSPQPVAIIETRGEGGFVMAPPTPNYTPLDTRIPDGIPTITPEQREDLLGLCRSFNEVFKEPRPVQVRTSSTYKSTPWGEYNNTDDWQEVLASAGWSYTHSSGDWDYWRRPGKEEGHSASWNRETRQFYVFSSSTQFEIEKAYKPFDILIHAGCGSDTRKAITVAKTAGYGKPFNSLDESYITRAVVAFNSGSLFADVQEMLNFDFEKDYSGTADVTLDQLIEVAHRRSQLDCEQWWVEDEKGNLKIDFASLGDFLERRGYRLLVEDEHSHSFRVVRIDYENHWIYHIPIDVFRKELEKWAKVDYAEVQTVSVRKLRNLIRSIADTKITSTLHFLPRIPFNSIRFLKKAGDETHQWFTFRNTAVKITNRQFELVPYSSLEPDMLLWKQDIIDFDFEVSDIEKESEFNESVIWLFFKRIAGIRPDIEHLDHMTELQTHYPDIHQRFLSLITIIGYLLSTHKNEDEPIMPIFEENTEHSEQGGGTGKGLIFQIIGCLRKVVNIDCKLWDPTKNFALQEVTLDTDIVHLEDVEPNFKMSKINNMITSGMTIENKYERAFKIGYQDAAKLAMSSNYSTSDGADFEARRQKKFYLERYFNKNNRPKNELGIIFGKSWTEQDYQLCYNILFYCLHTYLYYGRMLDCPPSAQVNRKYVEENYGEPMVQFLDAFTGENPRKWVMVHSLREEFFKQSGEKDRYWSTRRFKLGLSAYASRFGFAPMEWKMNVQRGVGTRFKEYCIFIRPTDEPVAFESKNIHGEEF